MVVEIFIIIPKAGGEAKTKLKKKTHKIPRTHFSVRQTALKQLVCENVIKNSGNVIYNADTLTHTYHSIQAHSVSCSPALTRGAKRLTVTGW